MERAPVDIIQVLLLFDEKSSADYGLALWAGLNEVEAFYNSHGKQVNARRFYISPFVPSSGFFLDTLRSVAKFFTQREVKNALDVLQQDERVQRKLSDAASMAKMPNTKTYDQERLIAGTREKVLRDRLGEIASAIPLMIVTDRPITPPENWRYIIWESWPSTSPTNAVISTAPLDPNYWSDPDPHRIAVIKNRVRTAALSVCGEFLGLHSCHNPRCFLCEKVDSVTSLDQMSRLGEEHNSEVEGLVGLGFDPIVTDPNVVQEVKQIPRRGGAK
jgi:predicted Zn-dependent protease